MPIAQRRAKRALTRWPRLGKSSGEEDGCTAVPSELPMKRPINVVLRASRRSRAGRSRSGRARWREAPRRRSRRRLD